MTATEETVDIEQIVARVLSRLRSVYGQSVQSSDLNSGTGVGVDSDERVGSDLSKDETVADNSQPRGSEAHRIECRLPLVSEAVVIKLFPAAALLQQSIYLRRRANDQSQKLVVPKRSVVTPSAREWLEDRGIRLVRCQEIEVRESAADDAIVSESADQFQEPVPIETESKQAARQETWTAAAPRVCGRFTLVSEQAAEHAQFDELFDAVCKREARQIAAEVAARVRRGEFVICLSPVPERTVAQVNRHASVYAAKISETSCLTRLQLQMPWNVAVLHSAQLSQQFVARLLSQLRNGLSKSPKAGASELRDEFGRGMNS